MKKTPRTIRKKSCQRKLRPSNANFRNRITFCCLEPRQLLAADLVTLPHLVHTSMEAQTSIVSVSNELIFSTAYESQTYHRLVEVLPKCETNAGDASEALAENPASNDPCLHPVTAFNSDFRASSTYFANSELNDVDVDFFVLSDVNRLDGNRLFYRDGSNSFSQVDPPPTTETANRVGPDAVLVANSNSDSGPSESAALAPVSMMATARSTEAIPMIPMELDLDAVRDAYFTDRSDTFQNPLAAKLAGTTSSLSVNSVSPSFRSGLIGEHQSFAMIDSTTNRAMNSLAISSKNPTFNPISSFSFRGSDFLSNPYSISMDETPASSPAFFSIAASANDSLTFHSLKEFGASEPGPSHQFEFSKIKDTNLMSDLQPAPVLRLKATPVRESRLDRKDSVDESEKPSIGDSISAVDSSLLLFVLASNVASRDNKSPVRKKFLSRRARR